MCRLLGIIASERTSFHFALHAGQKSPSPLSLQHPHGWGVGVFDPQRGWRVQKRPVRASDCEDSYEASSTICGELLLAHVRSRTVGPATAVNTHPFRQERWLFAHSGTITNTGFLRSRTSIGRLRQVEGQTDSELFFAYLLTFLDEAGVANQPASERTDLALSAALKEALARPSFGACNFLLSDGDVIYAHRGDRTLFLLESHPASGARVHHESHETGVTIDTPWTAQRHALLIASEEMSDEPWMSLPEHTLVRCDRKPLPCWRRIDLRVDARVASA